MADDNPLYQYLHKKYVGAQDEYFDNKFDGSKSFNHDGIVKETRTFTYEFAGPNKFSHDLDTNCKDRNEAYTNFKITPSGYVKSVELEVGGQRHEKSYRHKFLRVEPEIYQMSGGRAIPRLIFDTNRLNIETETGGRFTLSYDVVTPNNDVENTEDVYYQEQYTGIEQMSDTTETKIKLNFNHPIARIYTHISTDDVRDVRLILNGEDYGLVFQKNYDYYAIDFGSKNTINFSRIDKAILQITTNKPHPEAEVNTFAISKQGVRRQEGMAGMIYSK